jgi:hypothetical protein
MKDWIAHRQRRRPVMSLPGVALAVVALCLRLVWPTPSAPVSADIIQLTGLGEHALCLAAPVGVVPAPIRGDTVPPAGDRPDHDHSLCCLWHAAGGFVMPQVATAIRIAFTEAAPAIAAASEFRSADLIGPTRARGPPPPA